VIFQVLTTAGMKFRVFWAVVPLVTLNLTDVSEVRTASIIRTMNECRPDDGGSTNL
jgi:hypothetical protein